MAAAMSAAARGTDRHQVKQNISHGMRESARNVLRPNGTISTCGIGERIMGKYILGWFLGVPVIVLIIIYILFN
jgi:hypothetical protein